MSDWLIGGEQPRLPHRRTSIAKNSRRPAAPAGRLHAVHRMSGEVACGIPAASLPVKTQTDWLQLPGPKCRVCVERTTLRLDRGA
jgi:hypothetical protein